MVRQPRPQAVAVLAETYFAVCAPGLEPYVAAELRSLGITMKGGKRTSAPVRAGAAMGGLSGEEGGGVAFGGGRLALYRANLHLRAASRVLVRLGEFPARAFAELRKRSALLPWHVYLRPGQAVHVRVTCHKSRLYHSDAVAERVLAAIGDHLGRPSLAQKDENAQLVVVRLLHDVCTISIDSSGDLLHRRGYRLETAKAPLRETLAAGLLLASGWDGRAPLLDPFCGSGTIPIEAALIACGAAPGRARRFALMNWPEFQPTDWQTLLDTAAAAAHSPQGPILASDRDAGAVGMAQANAARASVQQWITLNQQAVSAIQPPPGPGWVVTNPPYGVRVSASKDLRNLYAQLGNVLRAQCPGWHVAILCSERALLGQTGLLLDTSLSLVNGGLSVVLGRGIVPE